MRESDLSNRISVTLLKDVRTDWFSCPLKKYDKRRERGRERVREKSKEREREKQAVRESERKRERERNIQFNELKEKIRKGGEESIISRWVKEKLQKAKILMDPGSQSSTMIK